VGLSVLARNGVKRFWNLRFLLVSKIQTENQGEPKAVGQDNVMKKPSQFVILRGSWMMTNRPQQ
jgi:hypothetical protein